MLKPKYDVQLVELDGKHFYDVTVQESYALPGSRVLGIDEKVFRLPGTTGILSQISKPALIPWAAKMAAEQVRGELYELLHSYDVKSKPKLVLDKEGIDALVARARKRPDKEKDDAAELGTRVHSYVDMVVENIIEGKKAKLRIPTECKAGVAAFRLFMKENPDLYPIMGDTCVADLQTGVGGSFDFLWRRRSNGNYVLGDLKTSNRIYPETALQISNYSALLFSTYGIKADEGFVLRVSKTDPKEYEVKWLRSLDASYEAFDTCRRLKEQLKGSPYLTKKELANAAKV